MNKRQIGIFLIILGMLAALFVYGTKLKEDRNIDLLIELQGGSCYLADGTCLHDDRDYTLYIIGFVISLSMIVLGIYLFLFDKTENMILDSQKQVASQLNEAKKSKEFDAFLSGFDEDEQKVLKAVRAEEGIKQSTLRYRTGMSKTALSLILKKLEQKKVVIRKKSKKTNEIFLKQKY